MNLELLIFIWIIKFKVVAGQYSLFWLATPLLKSIKTLDFMNIKNRNSQLNCSYFSAKYIVVFLYV